MENKRGSGIFLSVIGVATLIVAIIGATFAYFSATAASNNDAISVGSTQLALGWKDNLNGLKTNMIPSTQAIAEHAAFDEVWTDTDETVTVYTEFDAEGKGVEGSEKEIPAPGQCIDQNGNEICSVYDFYVGNPSTTTNMDVQASLTITTNDFTNLKYIIYDESDTVVESGTFTGTDTIRLTKMDQTLVAYTEVASREGVTDFTATGLNKAFDEKDPSTYQPSVDMSDPDNSDTSTNVRHYTMLIWINETGRDQTLADAGKMFAAGISFKTGGANGGGVTGIIAVADAA